MSDSASANAMEMPAPIEAASPTTNACHVFCVANAAANTGASVDTEPSISPASPGWITRRTKDAPGMRVLAAADVVGQVLVAQLVGAVLVLHLGLGQVAEQFAHRDVLAARGGAAVELLGLGFHAFGEVAHFVEVQRIDLPDRLVVDEAAHVLAADQRNVLAEFRPVEFEQALAMLALLLGHLGEDIGAGRVVGPQAFGDIGIDAVVLFLVGDRQREDFAFRQVGEIAHGAHFGGWRPAVK